MEGDFLAEIYTDAERHGISKDNAYTYDMLVSDIVKFKEENLEIPVFSIGKSVEGRELYAFKIGSGSRRVFICGAHHGMEWLTAKVCMEFGKELTDNNPSTASGPPPLTQGMLESSVYIVPMVNPDGVEIAASGYRWQANARGVDLNHNYDALWSLSRVAEEKFGIVRPCASKYGGEYPESEPESRAVADFTRENNFDAVFALHSQGEVIYYDFCGIVPEGSEKFLRQFEHCSDYVRDMPVGTAVYGGYKDWFIKKFKKPGFTIEIGRGENPLPLSDFDEVYSGVRGVLQCAIGF